jgi:hypothetical protein
LLGLALIGSMGAPLALSAPATSAGERLAAGGGIPGQNPSAAHGGGGPPNEDPVRANLAGKDPIAPLRATVPGPARFFERNEGQFSDSAVNFVFRAEGLVWHFRSNGVDAWVATRQSADGMAPDHARTAAFPLEPYHDVTREFHWELIAMRFAGGVAVTPTAGPGEGTLLHYVRGGTGFANDRSAQAFESIVYPQVFPGMDLVFRTEAGRLKYELDVKERVGLESFGMEVPDSVSLEVRPDGALRLRGQVATLEDAPPRAWTQGGRSTPCHYTLSGASGFGFGCDAWDGLTPLVVDPLLFSTYLGGSGYDLVEDLALTANGSVVVVGRTLSVDFPVPLSLTGTSDVSFDAFVSVLSPNGSALLSTMFLGGSGDDFGHAVAIAADGSILVAGRTNSNDFPTRPSAAAGGRALGQDSFVARLSPSGNSVVFSAIVGGNGTDGAHGVAPAGDGGAIVCGDTDSDDFPVVGPPLVNRTGGVDAFVYWINSTGEALAYSAFLGGSDGYESCVGTASTGGGEAVLAGTTNSTNFPTTAGAFATASAGGSDIFLAAANLTTGTIEFSTLVGGAADEIAGGFSRSSSGRLWVAGQSLSNDLPTSSNAFRPAGPNIRGAFVLGLDSNGSSLSYASFLGTGDGDWAMDVAEAPDGSLVVVGSTASRSFPVTEGALQTKLAAPSAYTWPDAFIIKLNASGQTADYGTYFGDLEWEYAGALALVSADVAVVGGYTNSAGFQITEGAPDNVSSGGDGFVASFVLRRPVLEFRTSPPGLEVELDGTRVTAPWKTLCNESKNINVNAPSPQWQGSLRLDFVGWSDGGLANHNVPCVGDALLVASFQANVNVSLSTDPAGLHLLVDGADVPTPAALWWPLGSNHTVEALGPQSWAETRWQFSAWDGGGAQQQTVTAVPNMRLMARFVADAYAVGLNSEPLGRRIEVDGVAFSTPSILWLLIGTTHTLHGPSPQAGAPGERFLFASWAGGAVGDEVLTVTAPANYTAHFSREVAYAFESIRTPLSISVDGSLYLAPVTGWWADGTSHWVNVSSSRIRQDRVEYAFDGWRDSPQFNRSVVALQAVLWEALFEEVGYAIDVQTHPDPVQVSVDGVPLAAPALFWAQKGTTHLLAGISGYEAMGTRYSLDHWVEGGSPTVRFSATRPLNFTAVFSREFMFVIGSEDPVPSVLVDSERAPPGTAFWWAEGTHHWIGSDPLVALGAGRRLVWDGWSDNGSLEHQIVSAAPREITVDYALEFFLVVRSQWGLPSCGNTDCWYGQGSTSEVAAPDLVAGPWGTRYVCRGWRGDVNSTACTASVIMDRPKTVEVAWSAQFLIEASSAYGSVVGAGWYDNGSTAVVTVAPEEITVDGRRLVFQGWSGQAGGSDPRSGVQVGGPFSLVAVWGESPGTASAEMIGVLVVVATALALVGLGWVRRRRSELSLRSSWERTADNQREPPPSK